MKHYPVQIISTIKNKDNPIISDFIKSIDYKTKGEGDYNEDKPHFIQYTFSYKNAVKFMKLLENLGYMFKIKLYVKTIKGRAIYE
jgi:hypothetical protein